MTSDTPRARRKLRPTPVQANGVPLARIIPERRPDGTRRLTPEQERILAARNASLRRGWPRGRTAC